MANGIIFEEVGVCHTSIISLFSYEITFITWLCNSTNDLQSSTPYGNQLPGQLAKLEP